MNTAKNRRNDTKYPHSIELNEHIYLSTQLYFGSSVAKQTRKAVQSGWDRIQMFVVTDVWTAKLTRTRCGISALITSVKASSELKDKRPFPEVCSLDPITCWVMVEHFRHLCLAFSAACIWVLGNQMWWVSRSDQSLSMWCTQSGTAGLTGSKGWTAELVHQQSESGGFGLIWAEELVRHWPGSVSILRIKPHLVISFGCWIWSTLVSNRFIPALKYILIN